MAYIIPKAIPFVQLQQIGVQSAYTTQAEETSKKAVLSYHYEAKRNVCIVSLVAIVALAVILGPAVNKHLSMLVLGIFVPIGAWTYFKAKHSNLEKLHQIDYDACIEILKGIARYITELRNNKINLLKDQITLNSQFEDLSGILVKAEAGFDKRTAYDMVCENAKKARCVINSQYEDERKAFTFATGPIASFLNACDSLTPKEVILVARIFQTGKVQAEWRQVVEHPYNSLLPRQNTVLVKKSEY